MVRITYVHGAARATCESDATRVLLTSPRGDYLQLGAPNLTNYDGYFLRTDNTTYTKILWNLLPAGELREVIVRERDVIRRFATAEQHLTLTNEGLLARCTGAFTLTLDCKRRYDERDDARNYTISHTPAHDAHAQRGTLARVSTIDITYEKSKEYVLCVSIATTMDPQVQGRWRAVPYAYDDKRGTHATRWVYDALMLEGDGFVAVCAHEDVRVARRSALSLLVHAREAFHRGEWSSEKMPLALAARALRALVTSHGVFAGIPWFTRVWSRDELIALGGLVEIGEYEYVLDALDRWYMSVRADGTLPAMYPDEGLVSADAPGWLGVRTLHVLAISSLRSKLTSVRLRTWEAAQRSLLDRIARDVRDGLVWSGAKTTWMDTDAGGGARAGARVEIQALAIALCDAHTALCERLGISAAPYDGLGRTIAQGVRDRLVREGVLLDGLWEDGSADTLIRPNLFLAWYAYPALFSSSQWKNFFAYALPSLWLSWGGLASLQTSAPQFHASDSGEDTASYHAGDSWYFVNNIAALALQKVGGFDREACALVTASLRDLMTQGVLGHASEISSAGVQEACGCHAQAWSASTLVEALASIKPSIFSKN